MFRRLGQFVSRYWLLTILAWIVLVVAVRLGTPKWDSVTLDGDFAYLPARMPSVQGERLLELAFPDGRSKSEAVVILARSDGPIDVEDLSILRSLVGRFQNLLGTSCFERATAFRSQADQTEDENLAKELREGAELEEQKAREAFEEAVDRLQDEIQHDDYFAVAAHNLALTYGPDRGEQAESMRKLAWDLRPALRTQPDQLADSHGVLPVLEVQSRYTSIYGSRLTSQGGAADLIRLRLSDEFMAVENISLIELLEAMLTDARRSLKRWPEELQLGLSGSAAVGTDMLRSARESIQNTEIYTVTLVVIILLLVYRSPMLVAVPLITIVVSLVVAMGLVAQLTTLDQLPSMEWWNFKIFTTTKIFVIVILFGAGTDYCLFLISRYKEALDAGRDKASALAAALGGVGPALAASALTTILGLSTMYFAQFGKFRNSGPAIGLCLFVTLLACVTLAPALLRALGSTVYWKVRLPQLATKFASSANGRTWIERFWERTSELIVKRPLAVLLTCTLLMLPLFIMGLDVAITYDLLSELSPHRVSKRGVALLRQHFAVGESGPIVVLAQSPGGDLNSLEGVDAIRDLTMRLYVGGVKSVRSLSSPAGRRPTQRPSNLQFTAQNYRPTQERYVSTEALPGGEVAKFELVLGHDPFSWEATQVLQRIDRLLAEETRRQASYWSGGRFVFAGTTAAIRDLRQVTSSDNRRIQLLVVFAVLMVLLILLRRPAVCIYLILSVLFSYYVTIGATELYFRWAYGGTYEGLDWKVPLFLFVILVAIGQDYNIYLATRVFEEQRRHGLFGGLRQAIVKTGGIITSCGIIMAGTFLSMTSGSMRGIVELGFALTLGVLLDTFVVRPILVPAFLALLFRWYAGRGNRVGARVQQTVGGISPTATP